MPEQKSSKRSENDEQIYFNDLLANIEKTNKRNLPWIVELYEKEKEKNKNG